MAGARVLSKVLGRRSGARRGVTTLVVVPATIADQNIFLADVAYRLVGVNVFWTVNSTSQTVQIEKCTGTTAPGSGTDLLTAVPTSSGAGTIATAVLAAVEADLRLAAGDRLAFDTAGTVGSLAGLVITLILVPLSDELITING